MSSEFFDEVVRIIESTGVENAHDVIEEQCILLGKTPDMLEPDDGSFLVLSLMTQLGDSIPKSEWEIIDGQFKELLSEEIIDNGKVKGSVIKGVMAYFSLKRGKNGLELLEKVTQPLSKFRNESWYPISILNDILTHIEDMSETSGFNRAKVIGEHIILNSFYFPVQHWFGTPNNEQVKALNNIEEIFLLDDQCVSSDNDCCIFSFSGINSEQLQQFISGICEGIQKIRIGQAGSVKLQDLDDGNSQIIIRSDPKIIEKRGRG